MSGGCPVCGCGAGSVVHRIAAAVASDDLDQAIDLGLLSAVPCPGCRPECRALVAHARDAREVALAARDHYRARQARLAARAQERAARRAEAAATSSSALPPAAAAALQRALARARKP